MELIYLSGADVSALGFGKPVGMGVLDLAIAARIYRRAKAEGVGTVLEY